MSSFREGPNEYDSKYEWDCFCQGGGGGIVFRSKRFKAIMEGANPIEELDEGLKDQETYITAFFEAFPKNPSCFIRGEGKTIEEAEEAAWQKYQKIISCDHEMERRGRTDGYAYCKHCSYSATVFEPLTKCCKCGKPTSYDTDFRGKYYCKKHAATKPKNPDKSKGRLWDAGKKRLPRKRKKLLKRCATKLFRENGINGKVTYENRVYVTFKCSGKKIDLLFKSSEKSLIAKYK